ncbi:uncharacterized protein N7459_005104 [Penicillium hispanicum]|uniref:uncharacterized protein n=1 Tax=Penicillium hispanicum TaxID=1080232 RepID=UPI002540C4F9|nr:uncharacterized protein N7459_005104 [Penicillium hispanicum]KAJ5585304.1 hypothetical protein N7459_005104 [Penicillium hispanicum]
MPVSTGIRAPEPVGPLSAWSGSILFLWAAASLLLAFRSRQRRHFGASCDRRFLQEDQSETDKAQRPAAILALSGVHIDSKQNIASRGQNNRRISKLAMVFSIITSLLFLILTHPFLVASINGKYRTRGRSAASSNTGLQEVFQVYQPVAFAPQGTDGCDVELELMDHVFGESYGAPFVGMYEPPSCEFDTVRINFTVLSRGVQYDRLALMYLGDVEVFRTSTAEPTSTGIVWTYIKEMSQYNALWQKPQKLIFDLGNIVNNVYTGSFNVTLTAHFSYENTARTADAILPISARNSASNSSSAFTVPSDNTTVKYKIPAAASRAVVAISACGQSEEEFWWSNVFSQDSEDFTDTVGELYGYSPFREVQLYIDGILAGVVWPFPVIFTGGVAPGFWHPIVGIDAFDLRQPEIDISPFLPLVQDGNEHSFEIRVTGLTVTSDGTATFADTVGSYWVVTGNIFLYTSGGNSTKAIATRGSTRPTVENPAPKFTVARNLVQDKAGGNDSLSYSVVAERTFTAKSSQYSWSQKLSFSNYGLLNQQGYSQVNKQLTSGKSTITELGRSSSSHETTFSYPLLVNATYGLTKNSMTIDSWMKRGLEIDSSGGPGISTYTFVSGPSKLHTTQAGKAFYRSGTGVSSISTGNTTDEFQSSANGVSYARSVKAVNGAVVHDTHPEPNPLSLFSGSSATSGRDSVRSMLGRGPGAPAS